MIKLLKFSFLMMMFTACSSTPKFDPTAVSDAGDKIQHVEPLSWWTGMNTPLELMVHGDNISKADVRIEGEGMILREVHRADSPNYLFLDIEITASAQPGTRYLVFRDGDKEFKYAYELNARRQGSALRESFTTADAIYLLMPDRFANGDPQIDSTDDTLEKLNRDDFFGRHGGDLQGMIDHLDYIAQTGYTAIWSTPLLLDNEPTASYHGYACADYYRIDPRFGTNELYRDYVAKAHDKGLKIIMDIVTNHCGAEHWWMKDLPFDDWVHQFDQYTTTNNVFSTNMDSHASRYDLHLQESGWFDHAMPDMNLDNEFLLRYFIQWAVWWIEYADLDGLRVDTYPYNEKEPMSRWCASVLEEYPHLNIVGECWTNNVPQLAYWQGGQPNHDGFDSHLPSIMDFPLQDAITKALPTDSLRWGEGMIRVYEALANDFVYHDLSKMLIFVGNHDTTRIGDIVKGNLSRSKLAVALLTTLRGIPQFFAGDELLFRSKDLSQGHGGLRVDFPGGWAGDSANLFTAEGREGDAKELYDYTKTLLQWRKTKTVLHDGKTLHFVGRDNTYAYFRYNDSEAVFVYINNSRGKKTIPWDHYAEFVPATISGRDVISGEEIELSSRTIVGSRQALIVEFQR